MVGDVKAKPYFHTSQLRGRKSEPKLFVDPRGHTRESALSRHPDDKISMMVKETWKQRTLDLESKSGRSKTDLIRFVGIGEPRYGQSKIQ